MITLHLTFVISWFLVLFFSSLLFISLPPLFSSFQQAFKSNSSFLWSSHLFFFPPLSFPENFLTSCYSSVLEHIFIPFLRFRVVSSSSGPLYALVYPAHFGLSLSFLPFTFPVFNALFLLADSLYSLMQTPCFLFLSSLPFFYAIFLAIHFFLTFLSQPVLMYVIWLISSPFSFLLSELSSLSLFYNILKSNSFLLKLLLGLGLYSLIHVFLFYLSLSF